MMKNYNLVLLLLILTFSFQNLFSNNHFSNIENENHLITCDFPIPSINYNSGGTVRFKWDPDSTATSYQLVYRLKGATSNWITLENASNTRDVTNLVIGSEYEYKVNIECNGSWNDLNQATINYFTVNENPNNLDLKIIATYSSTGVILRWAPVDFKSWSYGNINGYELTRFTKEENGQELTIAQQEASKVILAAQLLPIPEDDWDAIYLQDEIAAVAAAAIYESEFVVEGTSTDLVTTYNIQKQKENRFGLSLFAADQSFLVAEAMGLGYKDNTINPNNKYIYRVQYKNVPSTTQSSAGALTISTTASATLPQPPELRANPGDLMVNLSWINLFNGKVYSSYDVERSEDGGNTFSKVNAGPVIHPSTGNNSEASSTLFYLDSLQQNNTEYQYRVLGKSPFGIYGPPSDTVAVIGKPSPIQAFTHIATVSKVDSDKLAINWKFDASMENKIQGFNVYRSSTAKGNYEKVNTSLLDKTSRTYTDLNPESSNYYKVFYLDENDYQVGSYPSLGQLEDSTPPNVPVRLEGQCDDSGNVSLSWQQNTEPDLLGYRVFVANAENGNFTQVTNTWVDKNKYQYRVNINTLTEDVFFKVLALDNHENYSDLSEAVKVQRPDIIPPVSPVFKNVIARPTGVNLTWILSTSNDVEKHVLQRRSENDLGWTNLLELQIGNSTNEFVDNTASIKYMYSYRLLAYDEANNVSSSKILKAKPIDTGIRGEIVNIGISGTLGVDDDTVNSFAGDGSSVTLYWSYPDMEGLYDFQIYKKINGGAMHTFKIIKAKEAAGSVELNNSGNVTSFQFMDLEIQSGSSGDGTGNDAGNGSGSGDTKNEPSGDDKGGGAAPAGVYSYTYVIQARYIDGGSSPLSNSVSISF